MLAEFAQAHLNHRNRGEANGTEGFVVPHACLSGFQDISGM